MIGPDIPITIRPEAPGDEEIIFAITEAAFADMKDSDGDEQHLVGRLREAGDLTLSLVAEDGTRIVGHIAISPVTISDGSKGWFGLGPVSVWPGVQRAGIGGALVKRAIADMRAAGAKGIVLLGSPKYYSRFGFKHVSQITFSGSSAEYFQALLLDGDMPSGTVTYAPGFYP
ncbi:GNAT family N-acetyltransferase [Erythrobacter sp. KY5]|uniref:GNAT family N-acetyltransferase n=1 Tax=Erythrobacter sp. KY5 TaxID=2011159 RepID=UPI000DBF1C7D|nr:N-acetyltransferase [Erythrobacter sp. KY5]AWW73416.1 GNAT family N-acetyltransferase [Erythrobacter sp. KY5]